MEEVKIIAFKRGAGKNKVSYKVTDIYKMYRKHGGTVKNQRLFTRINREFWNMMVNEMMENNFEFTFLRGLGTMRIERAKKRIRLKDNKLDTSNLIPDWKATKLLWMENPVARENKKLIFHMNEHTEGYWFRFKWDKSIANFRNKIAYSFVPTRNNKKKLIEAIKNGKTDRYESNKYIHKRK